MIIRTLLAAVALGPALPAQTTWYVDVNGTPPGTGTPGNPFTSLQYAIAQPAVQAFDTIVVAPGTYLESIDYLGKPLGISGLGATPDEVVLRPTQPGAVVRMTQSSGAPSALANVTVLGDPALGTIGIDAHAGAIARVVVRGHRGWTGAPGQSVGLWVSGGLTLQESTLVDNETGIADSGGSAFVSATNTISWGNVEDVSPTLETSGILWYCLWSTGASHAQVPGAGNLNADPLLWKLAAGDVHLAPGSPCIDAGNPASPPDPDGSPIDIGALTYSPVYAPAPAPYCTAKVTSGGCVPAIGWSGFASLTAPGPFLVCASQVEPAVVGICFYGHAPAAIPFQGGYLCASPPIERTPPQLSGGAAGQACSGSFGFDLSAWAQGGNDPSLAPGGFVYFEYWFRDPPAASGSGLSDALEVGLAP